MTGAGFYEPQKFRPTGLALVVAMHAAALGALVLVKSPVFERAPPVITRIFNIPLPPEPVENPPPPVESEAPLPPVPTTTPTVIELPPPPQTVRTYPPPPAQDQFASNAGTGTEAPALPPLRIEAGFDPRFAADQQPPYPTSEERAQRDGRVRLRVTIGADGRVKAVQRLEATSDAFWRSTERHALSRWRFRPATVDGRPVESTKVLTITFQIEV
jgi:periplasmic protein TonB